MVKQQAVWPCDIALTRHRPTHTVPQAAPPRPVGVHESMRFLVFAAHALLSLALALTLILAIGHRHLSAAAFSEALERSGAYAQVLPLLPRLVANWTLADVPASDRANGQEVLAVILTHEVVRSEVDRTLAELEAVLKRDAPLAELHLDRLPHLARQRGLALPPERFESLEFARSEMHPQRQLFGYLARIKWVALGVSGLLLALGWLWAKRRRSYRALGVGLVASAVLAGSLAVALRLGG